MTPRQVKAPRTGLRIGVLGGSFNPIHLGHLRCAEEVREALGLERVLFIPSACLPHKPHRGLASAEHRFAMVRRAISGNPFFRASALEIARAGRSYSIDTLHELHRRLRNVERFVFLLGVDTFRELETWKRWEELFSLADFAVFNRPPEKPSSVRDLLPAAARRRFRPPTCPDRLRHESGKEVYLIEVTPMGISASDIRRRLATGQSVRYLMPPTVHRYIQRHGLYVRGSRQP